MKQHPDRQPRRAVTVQRRNDDDRQTDQNFESDRIDGVTPEVNLQPACVSRRLECSPCRGVAEPGGNSAEHNRACEAGGGIIPISELHQNRYCVLAVEP